ncbi:MAG: OsmC family protein [Dehalococcoidia bacterium]
MTGTLRGTLAARQINVAPSDLEAEAEGDIETIDGGRMIILSRVRIKYRVKVPKGQRETAERALEVHHRGCPVYQSLARGIQVEWAADIQET